MRKSLKYFIKVFQFILIFRMMFLCIYYNLPNRFIEWWCGDSLVRLIVLLVIVVFVFIGISTHLIRSEESNKVK